MGLYVTFMLFLGKMYAVIRMEKVKKVNEWEQIVITWEKNHSDHSGRTLK